jgi:hypothetical protein
MNSETTGRRPEVETRRERESRSFEFVDGLDLVVGDFQGRPGMRAGFAGTIVRMREGEGEIGVERWGRQNRGHGVTLGVESRPEK